jgi:hypothetical protein
MMHGYFDEDPARFRLWPLEPPRRPGPAPRWGDADGLILLAAEIVAARWTAVEAQRELRQPRDAG